MGKGLYLKPYKTKGSGVVKYKIERVFNEKKCLIALKKKKNSLTQTRSNKY